MNNDLVWIQNNYGDTMMKICKLHFSMILELPGMMPRILKHNFQMNRGLIKDILLQGNEEDFKRFIYYKVKDVPNIENKNFKSPYQLMKEAGYTLYKCETDEEIKYFQKYYSKGEELSTCHIDNIKRTDIFFGVKNNVSEIKRSSTPNRDDEYGTSVISIQFNDGDVNDVSIKNRYNHTVWSPDATFDNKLDNIINGLTDSFENEFGYQINNSKDLNNFKLEDYILGPDNKYYKCNVSLNNISYCADNVVIKDNKVTTYDSKRYVLIENYLVDKYENTIKDLSGNDKTFDKKFKNIKVRIKQGKKEIRLTEYDSDIISKIYTNENSEVVELDLPNLKVIGSDFFQYNRKLKRLKLKNVEEIGRNFLTNNQALKDINIPLVKKISSSFISQNEKIEKINLPKLEKVGSQFLSNNKKLDTVNLPSLQKIDNYFLATNEQLKEAFIPKVEEIGDYFLKSNTNMEDLDLPKAKKIGNHFMQTNNVLTNLNLKNAKKIGNEFLFNNLKLKEISLPDVTTIGNSFLATNKIIENIVVPKVENIGHSCLLKNERLKKLFLPNVKEIGGNFISSNKLIEEVHMCKVEKLGMWFLYENQKLKKIDMPLISELSNVCFGKNINLIKKNLFYMNIILKNKMHHIFNNNSFQKKKSIKINS